MLSPEEIVEQQQLLAAYRRTLAVYLRQQAEIGRAFSPPALINGIDETRRDIKRIKEILRAASAEVAEDPDDDEPPPPPRARILLTPAGGLPRWVWLAAAVALAIGVGLWWFSGLRNQTASQQEAPAATQEASSAAGQETPIEDLDVAELESRLMDANIALSAVQIEQVRDYLNNPDTGYKLLAEHALQVVGDHRFRDTLYLDELDVRYTDLVGQEHYAEFDSENLKAAMVRAWNEHYPDNTTDLFDQIVEARG